LTNKHTSSIYEY